MNKTCRIFTLIALAISGLMFTGCIDDNYDLSDIDTTVKVPVDNLVIPVNIEAIHLKNIMKLGDGSVIKVIDGQYTVQYDGEFESSDISLSPIVLGAPELTKGFSTISTAGLDQALEQLGEVEVPLPLVGTKFTYDVADVSTDIEDIYDIGGDLTIKLVIGFEGAGSVVNEVMFKNLSFQLPKGLTMASGEGQYNPTTGIYTVPDAKSTQDLRREVSFSANAINLEKSGVHFADHKLHYVDDLRIATGNVLIKRENLKVDPKSLPATITFYDDFSLSSVEVTWVTGRIHYAIKDFSIPDVELNDLPSILTQDETNILLENPQIYLKLNNPVGVYHLSAKTGIAITPWRSDVASATCRLNNGFFTIPATSSQQQELVFCLAPANPGTYPAGYSNPRFEQFSSLSDVLEGKGLPHRLQINLENPELPSQEVTRLPIGRSLGMVKGSYLLNAPLNLKAGSTIVYSDKVDGWSSEDLDALTITTLEVTATVDTYIPLKVVCTGYPIDKDGKQINNVVIEGAEINANAKDQVITLRITGEIRNLDGVEFTARVDAENGETLNENMTISLKNIRPKVSGYYEKKL